MIYSDVVNGELIDFCREMNKWNANKLIEFNFKPVSSGSAGAHQVSGGGRKAQGPQQDTHGEEVGVN